jgi:hypothetical protein
MIVTPGMIHFLLTEVTAKVPLLQGLCDLKIGKHTLVLVDHTMLE